MSSRRYTEEFKVEAVKQVFDRGFTIREIADRSGYYAWSKQPKSQRQREDERLSGLIKQLWLESACVYGYRKIHDDLRELGES